MKIHTAADHESNPKKLVRIEIKQVEKFIKLVYYRKVNYTK